MKERKNPNGWTYVEELVLQSPMTAATIVAATAAMGKAPSPLRLQTQAAHARYRLSDGQGVSVALSADGNTAIVGGPYDNGQAGAAWAYTRSGGVWTQQGSKLVGTGAIGNAAQGSSVALSADGNAAFVEGPADNSNIGAAWAFSTAPSLQVTPTTIATLKQKPAALAALVAKVMASPPSAIAEPLLDAEPRGSAGFRSSAAVGANQIK